MDELEDYSEYNGLIQNLSKNNSNINFQSNYSEYHGLLPSNFKFFEDNLNELIPYDFKFNEDIDLDPISLNHLFKDKLSSILPWDKLDGFCYLSKEEDNFEPDKLEDEVLDNRLNLEKNNKDNIGINCEDADKKQNDFNHLNTNILKKICDLEGIVFEKVKNPNNIQANHNIIKNNIVQYIKMVENHLIGSILSFMIEKQSPVKLDDLEFFLKDKIENMRKANGCKYSENIHKVIYSTLISNKIFRKSRVIVMTDNNNDLIINQKDSANKQQSIELFYFDENEATDYILNTIEKEIENSQKVKRNLKNKKINNCSSNNVNLEINSSNKKTSKEYSMSINDNSLIFNGKFGNFSKKKFKDENNINLLSFLPFSNSSNKSSISNKKKDSNLNISDMDIEMNNNGPVKHENIHLREENSINSTIITDQFNNSSNYSSFNNSKMINGNVIMSSNYKNIKKSGNNNLNAIKKKVNKVYEILDDLLNKFVNKNELESNIISNLKKSKDEFEIVKQLGDDNCCMGIIVCLKFFKKTSK